MLNSLSNGANRTYTENGAATYETTYSDCLDLFATIGALRQESDEEIVTRFLRAYAENRELAMKLLFFARDVRGGLGERRVFRTILRWLSQHEPSSVRHNIAHIASFGRWDDLLSLLDTPCESDALSCVKEQLSRDLAARENGVEVSLLAKWLPSVNASNAATVHNAKRVARFLAMDNAAYRKTLVKLRASIRLIENNLRRMDYTFDYAKQPSKALFKYRAAFARHDRQRYGAFLDRVAAGEESMHTGALTPYEIIRPFFGRSVSQKDRSTIGATWNAQEDFTNGENALVIVDGSGSMYGGADPLPAAVALSLGIYFAQRNTGAFKGHFITFSQHPQLVEIKGQDILDMVRYCSSFNECDNTNLQKVFELILAAALKKHAAQDEMPATLYIISDMEFDCCAEGAETTNFDYAKQLYAAHGYHLPKVVFWNVASRSRQQPVTQNEQGVALVSGCTPRIFGLLQSGVASPYAYMLEVLGSERYQAIVA